jgi:RNase adapter protein RapZ
VKPVGKERKLFIITGISGAGKSQALKVFEDFGFFCVDNLPIALLEQFGDLLNKSREMSKVALGMDIREGKQLAGLPKVLKALKARGLEPRVIFLDASDDVIIHRFSETRHKHPLGIKIGDAVPLERRLLIPLKEIADKVINTSSMTLGELKEAVSQTLELTRTREMTLSILSFGFKYGMPLDADIVMDVRFLPNPNYISKWRRKTGLDKGVQGYVLENPITKKFLEDYLKLITSLLPHYVKEGKSYLTIAVGCTGGRHRSVFVTHYLAQKLRLAGHPIQEFHRDIDL